MLVLALDTATPTLVAGVARWSTDGAEVLAEYARGVQTARALAAAPIIAAQQRPWWKFWA